MRKKICKDRLKKMMFGTLVALSMSAMIIPNVAQAASNEESQGVVASQPGEAEIKCIEGPTTYQTTKAAPYYANSSTANSMGTFSSGTYLYPTGVPAANSRLEVKSSSTYFVWVKLSDIKLITCSY